MRFFEKEGLSRFEIYSALNLTFRAETDLLKKFPASGQDEKKAAEAAEVVETILGQRQKTLMVF